MFRRWFREYYLLARGEQRALVFLGLLLLLTLMARVGVGFLPAREPPDMEDFAREAGEIIAAFEQPVDLNRADSARLIRLPGIGPVLSARIIKYRDLLGGFVSTGQLEEVYGLSRETVEKISASLWIDPEAVRMLDINRATFSDLLRHPYLDYEEVRSLVNYREYKGRIGSAREIRENHLLPDSVLEKMIPYLKFDHS
jgi:DNA uptake protein ComE-like DNA-binding protein